MGKLHRLNFCFQKAHNIFTSFAGLIYLVLRMLFLKPTVAGVGMRSGRVVLTTGSQAAPTSTTDLNKNAHTLPWAEQQLPAVTMGSQLPRPRPGNLGSQRENSVRKCR